MSGLSSSTHAHFAASILPWKDFENIAMSHAYFITEKRFHSVPLAVCSTEWFFEKFTYD